VGGPEGVHPEHPLGYDQPVRTPVRGGDKRFQRFVAGQGRLLFRRNRRIVRNATKRPDAPFVLPVSFGLAGGNRRAAEGARA